MKSPLLALLVLVGLGSAACSGDDPAPPPAASPSDAADAGEDTTATDGVITPADVPAIPEFAAESRGVIGDVEVESCDTDPGTVAATGTATNSADSARDVVVVISWTVGDTGDVVARGVATLEDLGPGRSADWDVEASVPGSRTATCVTTALAGQVAS